jgi:membrane-associated protease RseP (regulator of RpoE activity)
MKSLCVVAAIASVFVLVFFPPESRAAETVTQLEELQVREEPIAWFGISVAAQSHGFFGQPKAPFVVVKVAEKSPAHRAGIQVLDQIVSIDGDTRLSFEDIGRQLYRASSREKIEVVVRRPLARDAMVIQLQATSKESLHIRSRDSAPTAVFWDVLVISPGKLDVKTPPRHPKWKNVARSCSLSWGTSLIIVGEVPGQGVLVSVDPPSENQHQILQGELIPTGSTIRLLESGGYEVERPPQK